MKFYRANRDAYDYLNKDGVVPNELLTEKERNSKVRYLSNLCFDEVEVSKKDTYWSFGRRFQCGYGVNGKVKEYV